MNFVFVLAKSITFEEKKLLENEINDHITFAPLNHWPHTL